MATVTRSGAFGRTEYANYDFAPAINAASGVIGGLFSTLTGRYTTQTGIDWMAWQEQESRKKTVRLRNAAIAVASAAAAALAAFLIIRKRH